MKKSNVTKIKYVNFSSMRTDLMELKARMTDDEFLSYIAFQMSNADRIIQELQSYQKNNR